jgi:hypothetical protein
MEHVDTPSEDPERDRGSDTYAFEWNGTDDRPLSAAIAYSVAEVDGTDPTELEPLNDTVDTDALDRLFGTSPGVPRDEGFLVFQFAGYDVTVFADGLVTIRDVDDLGHDG